jgi:hypothetical protein
MEGRLTMSSMPATASELHVPYYIFLKCAGRCADADLLGRFGLANYRRVAAANSQQLRRHATFADAPPWTLLADDWYYTLWHSPTTRPALEELAEECDVFACSIGDCDRSFDFIYYKDRRLIRKYVVSDPHFRGRELVQNVGYPLPGESAALQHQDEAQVVQQIANNLGIRTRYAPSELRHYAPPE